MTSIRLPVVHSTAATFMMCVGKKLELDYIFRMLNRPDDFKLNPSYSILKRHYKTPRKATFSCYRDGKVCLMSGGTPEEAIALTYAFVSEMTQVLPQACVVGYACSNIQATANCGATIWLDEAARRFPDECTYEPEMFQGLQMRSSDHKSLVARVHHTGSVTLTGSPSLDEICRFFLYICKQLNCVARFENESLRSKYCETLAEIEKKIKEEDTRKKLICIENERLLSLKNCETLAEIEKKKIKEEEDEIEWVD